METSQHRNRRDGQALTVGIILILSVGAYFITKSFFWNRGEVAQAPIETTSDTKKDSAPMIAPDVLLKKIQNDEKITLVDIRTETAYGNDHIAHSLPMPIGSLQNFSPNQDEAVVIVFSEADIQTLDTAKNILAQKSFPYFFIKGGFGAWKSISAPTVSLGDPNSFIDQSKITYIELDAFKKLLSEKSSSFFILDVQTEENYAKKHIVGAKNIPLTDLEKRAGEIPAGRQIVVYGENNLISFQGGTHLSDLGIFTAQTLSGDKYLTTTSGLPLEP